MRLSLPALFIFTALLLPACATPLNSSASSSPPPATATPEASSPATPVARIEAKGMSCPLCASNIDRRMQKLGIDWTTIDLGKGEIQVGLDPRKPAPTPEELQQAVSDAGYTAGAVTMPGGEVQP